MSFAMACSFSLENAVLQIRFVNVDDLPNGNCRLLRDQKGWGLVEGKRSSLTAYMPGKYAAVNKYVLETHALVSKG